MPMIFDFDDAVFVPYVSPSNGYLSLLKFPGKTAAICRLSSHVMAGNTYLAEYTSKVNRNVTIIPTTIDTDKYTMAPDRPASDPPVIGWSGSYSTVQHLDTLRGALARLAASQRFSLRVIGTPGYDLPGVDIEAMQWRSESEIADLRPIDIGVMPLPDDDWSRGKCGLKALQYMALGIPTICSGAIITEQIFRVPGIGSLLIGAILANDTPVIMAVTFVFACLVVLFNLIADVLYGWLDPRISYR